MKWFLSISLFMLLIPVAGATLKSLEVGESFSSGGKNVTLLGIHDTTLFFCLNNQRYLLSTNRARNYEGIHLFLKRIVHDRAVFSYSVSCKDCLCDDSCSNEFCGKAFTSQPLVSEVAVNPKEDSFSEITLFTKELEGQGLYFFSGIFFLFFLFVLLMYVWKEL